VVLLLVGEGEGRDRCGRSKHLRRLQAVAFTREESRMSEDELPRVLRLLWGHEEPGRRGPKPGHRIEDGLQTVLNGLAARIDAAGLAKAGAR
jgi:hypothetical protein